MTSDEIRLYLLDTRSVAGRPDDLRSFTHGHLRRLLAEELGDRPESLSFAYENGKPFLGGDHRESDLQFNLSHSGDRAVIVLARGRSVGVDIEKLRAVDVERLADRYFSKAEADVCRSFPAEKRESVFFHYWTAKEAYLKAKGVGIGQGLKNHTFSDPSENPPRLEWSAEGLEEAGRWRFYRFQPADGYVGTLAYFGDLAILHQADIG